MPRVPARMPDSGCSGGTLDVVGEITLHVSLTLCRYSTLVLIRNHISLTSTMLSSGLRSISLL